MNIGKISNVSFNGAYIIKGKGEDVKQAVDEIKKHPQCSIEGLEFAYTSADMPACVLVTTGKDTKKYNDFYADDKKKEAESFNKMFQSMPERFTKDDFKNLRKYMEYKANHQHRVWIAAIKKDCGFKNLQILDGEKVFESMRQGEFDYSEGKILNETL